MATNDELTTITLTAAEACEIRVLAKREYGATVAEYTFPSSLTHDDALTARLELLDSIISKVKDIR